MTDAAVTAYPLLSILIPTYNRPTELRRALSSCCSLGASTEIIIGNNGDKEVVDIMLRELPISQSVTHILNPRGSTYPQNLKTLIGAATGKYLTILHDDDFFTEESSCMPSFLESHPNVDFVFSDHWLADPNGVILVEETNRNSSRYGRCSIREGLVDSLPTLAISQSICLDCFFVRTTLAKACHVDTSLKCFADILLLVELACIASEARYTAQRIFAYRLSQMSLTTTGLMQDELLSVLQRCKGFNLNHDAMTFLDKRINRQALCSLKYCLKKRKLLPFCRALIVLLQSCLSNSTNQ
jgi:hypothetical protein